MLRKSCSLGPQLVLIESYWSFNPAVIQFLALSQRCHVFVSQKQKEMVFEAEPPLKVPNEVGVTARNWSPEVEEAI